MHDTIDAFGGDGRHRDLFGQSSGGDSIAHLMISDGARGLFRRAIVQSAPLGLGRGPVRDDAGDAAASSARPTPTPPSRSCSRGQPPAERAALRFGLRGGMPFGAAVRPRAAARRGGPRRGLARRRPARRPADGRDDGGDRALRAARPAARRADEPARRRRARAPRARPGDDGGRVRTRRAPLRRPAPRLRRSGRPVRAELGAARQPLRSRRTSPTCRCCWRTKEAWGRSALLGESGWAEVDRLGRRVRQIWADFARTGTLAGDAAAGLGDTLRLFRD